MEHSRNTKVYKFDFNLYKNNNLKKLIAYSILVVICFSTLILLNYNPAYTSVFFYIYSVACTLIVIFIIIKKFLAYFRAYKTHQDNNITIQIENGHIKSIDIKMRETNYDEYYSIKNITELHRNNYIDVKGEIYAPDTECLSDDSESYKTDLRIPPYFENMDEVYEELKKMKEQA